MKDFNQGKKSDLKDERNNIQKPGGAYNQNQQQKPQTTTQQPLPGKGGQTGGGTTQGGVGGINNKDKLGNVDFNKNKDDKSSWK
ncbi:MAG: hypothetical protein JO131_07420 [Gammaproteobacteria bacterium]|nr:hypothetical protein [Gammaproteobacteria bacterium]